MAFLCDLDSMAAPGSSNLLYWSAKIPRNEPETAWPFIIYPQKSHESIYKHVFKFQVRVQKILKLYLLIATFKE